MVLMMKRSVATCVISKPCAVPAVVCFVWRAAVKKHADQFLLDVSSDQCTNRACQPLSRSGVAPYLICSSVRIHMLRAPQISETEHSFHFRDQRI